MSTLFILAAQLMNGSQAPLDDAPAWGFAVVPVLAAPEAFPVIEVEPASPAEGFAPAPQFVFGTPFEPKCVPGADKAHFFDKVVRLVRRARVIGYRAVLAENGAVYLGRPLSNPEIIPDGTSPGREGFLHLRGPQDEPVLVIYNPVARERHFGRALFFIALEHSNYGSFLFRLLPKILLARDLGLKLDLIIVPERMSWTMQALGLANFDLPVMSASEACGYVFDELLVIDELNRDDPFMDPQSFVRIQELAVSARKRHARLGPDRLYVSRRTASLLNPTYRPLINEHAVEALASERGLRIVRPEMHSLSAQIALFANARQVVGPSGSGMLNTMFAPRGTPVVDIESFTVVVKQHARIYGSTGKPYGFVFGSIDGPELGRPQYRPWSVDCADVARALDHFSD